MKPFATHLPVGRALKVGRCHLKLLDICPDTFVATFRATPGRGLVAVPEGHWGEVAQGVDVRFNGTRHGKGRCAKLEIQGGRRRVERVPKHKEVAR